MSDWSTYQLSDFLLFSPRTYYRLFELYNNEIWPGQTLALLAGLLTLVLFRSPGVWQTRTIFAVLGASWLWVAWGYHYARYSTINWVATYYAMAFAFEAVLLIVIGVGQGLRIRRPGGWSGAVPAGLVVFGVTVQPLVGPLVGRAWSAAEIFAIAPDPTIVVTLGMLSLACGWLKWLLLPIPILWCLISGATAWAMHAPDAALMPVIAALALVAALSRRGGGTETGRACEQEDR
jgi:Family of unknown function (DUF6064)